MPKEICNCMLPEYIGYIAGEEDEHPCCLLAEGHQSPHLMCFSDGRYFIWSIVKECDCPQEGERKGEACTCFDYGELSLKQTSDLLEKEGPG